MERIAFRTGRQASQPINKRKDKAMYKKILFGTCLTDYCSHVFNFALNLAKENGAKLWIYHGLGRLNQSEEAVKAAIEQVEKKIAAAYVTLMRDSGFTDYAINVSDGDVVSEITTLARNAGIDAIVLGTSTETPLDTGKHTNIGSLGPNVTDTLLRAPCPVIIVPPALIPGLARG